MLDIVFAYLERHILRINCLNTFFGGNLSFHIFRLMPLISYIANCAHNTYVKSRLKYVICRLR